MYSWAALHKIIISLAAQKYFSFLEQHEIIFLLFSYARNSSLISLKNRIHKQHLIVDFLMGWSFYVSHQARIYLWFTSFMSSTKLLIQFQIFLFVSKIFLSSTKWQIIYVAPIQRFFGTWTVFCHHISQHILLLWTVFGIVDAKTKHQKNISCYCCSSFSRWPVPWLG